MPTQFAKAKAGSQVPRLLQGTRKAQSQPPPAPGPPATLSWICWIYDICKMNARKTLIKLHVLAIKMPRKYLPVLCAAFCPRQQRL